MRVLTGVIAVVLGLGCATVAPPGALVEARARYDAALGWSRANQDPAGLVQVKGLLDEASRVYAKEPGSKNAQRAAYRALNGFLRWQAAVDMAQAELVSAPLERLGHADPAATELAEGHFIAHNDSQERIGALGAATTGLGDVQQNDQGVVVRIASHRLFPRRGALLSPQARSRLERTSTAMQRYAPDARVRVVASVDFPADSMLNQRAATERARAVRDELVKAGVPPENVTFSNSRTAVGAGEEPRVEILISPLNPPAQEP